MTAFRLTPRVLAAPSHRISVIVDDNDPIACSEPVHWAAGQLQDALVTKGFLCDIVPSSDQLTGSTFCIAVASRGSSLARNFPQAVSPSATRRAFGSLPDIWQRYRRSWSQRAANEDSSMGCWSWRNGFDSRRSCRCTAIWRHVEEDTRERSPKCRACVLSEIEDKAVVLR